MNLVRTSVLNGIAVLTKLGTNVLLNKVLAVFVGPAGYAIIGQFQNLASMVTTFASGSLNNGVTKYTAQYHAEPERQYVVWRTAGALSLIGSLVCAPLLVLFRVPIAKWALADANLSGVIVWLAMALPLLLINGLLLAILNGRKAVQVYVAANIGGGLVSAATALLLVTRYGLYGALVAVAVSQALACVATAALVFRHAPIRLTRLLHLPDGRAARQLGGYALMGAISALSTPMAQIFIRDSLAAQLGWHTTGLWQALNKISDTHLMLLTTTLSIYFLPRFAEIQDGAELRAEIRKGYRFVLPLVLTSAALLFLFRTLLVRTLLTPDFMPLVDVLGIQLLGDVLKIGSWVMAYTLFSHAQTRAFIVTEILFSVIWAGSATSLTKVYGLAGACAGYALTYATYWITMFWLFRRLTSRLDGSKKALAAQSTADA